MYANAASEHGRYLAYQTNPPPNAPSNVFRNAEERGAGPSSRQRMSLLPHPQQSPGDYQHQHSQASHNQRGEGRGQQVGPPYGGDGMMKMVRSESPPIKKPRLGDSKPELHMPLRIDTERGRSGPAYNPQVEAISPTLPSESIRDESPLRSTKDDLLVNIARVDREIAKTESQIAKLKKKKVELEEAATQPQKEKDESSTATELVIQSLPQSIYADNRKKAAEAHRILLKLGPHNDLPLYNQPSDTPVYHENIAKYNEFKPRLLHHFRGKMKEKDKRDNYLTKTYAQLSIEWARNVERMENTSKRKQQESKKRELFEKVFPELRKQREDKERITRVTRIKSEAEMEEIMDGLHEQEMEDKKMRSYAVIPPALLDAKSRSRRFRNTNGLIEDPMQEYKDRQFVNLWTDQEKEIFKEKYLAHPKNFGSIKSYLDRKGIPDCVLYYYLSKKTENYRQLLRKSRARPRTRNQNNTQNNNNQNAASNNQVPSVVKPENNGVTTRQQREQKTEPQNVSSSNVPNQANSGNNNDGLINASSSPTIGMPMSQDDNAARQSPLNAIEQFGGQASGKNNTRDETKGLNDMDTSDEDMEPNGEKGGPHTCVCCKSQLENFTQSRPISKSQASMYGLSEADIQATDRVCVSCKSKAVRRRTKSSQCPIPTCPAKRSRIKRLRPFPAKWVELEESRRSAIIAKYQIPENCTKCCTACFNRINRRMAPNASLDTPDDPGCDTTRWNEEEIEWMKKGLAEFGTDWVKLSENIPSKSELQCRNFYLNYRKKYGLEALVPEHKKSKGGHGPPTLTDEEESGSTTSSCDETGATPHDQPRPSSNIEKKPQEDYDSSATVSAEEGVADSDKPISQEETKVFSNNPSSPLSLSLRATAINNSSYGSAHGGKSITVNPSHSSPGHGIRSSSPGGPLAAVSITPRHHSVVMPHVQISSPNIQASFHAQPAHGSIVSGLPPHMTSSQGSRRYPSPDNNDNQEPNMTLKVNDLLQATIEHHLRIKPPASNQSSVHPGPSVSPTITSILKSQDRSHLPPPGTQHIMTQVHHNSQNEPPHHPQLSVTPSIFSHPSSYYGPAKVERVIQHQHEGLSLVQIQPPRDECGTLDLSMKKRSPSPHMSAHRPPSNGPPPAHQPNQPLDFASRQQNLTEMYYQGKYNPMRGRPSPLPPPPVKQSRPPPPPLTKPASLSPMKDGSITHGLPMNHPQSVKYEGLLRPKEGSITQGTPVEKARGGKDPGPAYVAFDRSSAAEYYKRGGPANPPYFAGSSAAYYGSQRPPSSGQRSPPPGHPPSAYPTDQHNNSRQIIINDYYTSQQMQNPPGVGSNPHIPQNAVGQPRMDPKRHSGGPMQMQGGGALYGLPPSRQEAYRQTPSPSVPPHQQRQGVIQRANRVVVKVEPGRENDAFARLVDAAVSAPSLPVPKEEQRNRVNLPRVDMVREGLGKSMAEIDRNRNAPPPAGMYRSPSISMQQQPGGMVDLRAERMRMENDSRFREGPETLTAASLIDAIITHQINQPSPNDRHSPAPSKSDRLFASFQRASAQPQTSSSGNAHSGHNAHGSSGRDDDKSEDHRGPLLNHKGAPGGTWGEHINLIISNDYALGKGSGPSVVNTPTSQPPTSHPSGVVSQSPKPEDPQGYRSWKLRRALQREEQQKETDERSIIRMTQNDERPASRPPSHPPTGNEISENGNDERPPSNAGSSSSNDRFAGGKGGKDATISPLDYVNNLIMVRMRTENLEEKGEEDKGKPTYESVTPPSNHQQPAAATGSSSSSSAQANHVGTFPNEPNSGGTSSLEPQQRFSEASQDKKDDESRKVEESDSPASMIIDESNDDTKEKAAPSTPAEAAPAPPPAVATNQPNYEPLTDEET